MKDKFDELLSKAKVLKKEKPRYFYLNVVNVIFAFIFFITMMFPFYRVTLLGASVTFNMFNLKASFLYFIVFLAIPILIAYFAITENKKLHNLTLKISNVISFVYFFLVILIFIGDKNTNSGLSFNLSLGFYVMFLCLIVLYLLTWRPITIIRLLEKYMKFDYEDVVDAEIVSEKGENLNN